MGCMVIKGHRSSKSPSVLINTKQHAPMSRYSSQRFEHKIKELRPTKAGKPSQFQCFDIDLPQSFASCHIHVNSKKFNSGLKACFIVKPYCCKICSFPGISFDPFLHLLTSWTKYDWVQTKRKYKKKQRDDTKKENKNKEQIQIYFPVSPLSKWFRTLRTHSTIAIEIEIDMS